MLIELFDDTQIPVMMNMFIQLTVQQNPTGQKRYLLQVILLKLDIPKFV